MTKGREPLRGVCSGWGGGQGTVTTLGPPRPHMKRIPLFVIIASEIPPGSALPHGSFQMNSLNLTLRSPTLPILSYPSLRFRTSFFLSPEDQRPLCTIPMDRAYIREAHLIAYFVHTTSVVLCFSSAQHTTLVPLCYILTSQTHLS